MNFDIPQKAEFNDEIRKFETSDPAHADLFNKVIQKLFHNDLFLKRTASDSVSAHIEDKDNPHEVSASSIGAATQEALNTAYANGNAYTDTRITNLINGAPNTLDTLKEIADAMGANETVVDALEAAIGTKANQAELDTHSRNVTTHITASERTKWNTVDSALSAASAFPLQNKAVKAEIDKQTAQNVNFTNSITQINSNLTEVNQSLNQGNLDFDYVVNDGLYYNVQVGADTVRKKCSGTLYRKMLAQFDASPVMVTGVGIEGSVRTYAVSAKSVPDWQTLTSNNFVAVPSSRMHGVGDTANAVCSTKSDICGGTYNNTMGLYTVSYRSNFYGNRIMDSTCSISVYAFWVN